MRQQAIRYILDLQFDEARQAITRLPSPGSIYFASLCDALELIVSENSTHLQMYEKMWEKRLDELSKSIPQSAEKWYVMAELRLQWAFIYLKYGYELRAAWQVRQSYMAASTCRQQYSHYEPVRKTWGVLNVMLGSMPEKYQWVLRMLRLKGSLDTGLHELQTAARASDLYGLEASILLSLTQHFLLQQSSPDKNHAQDLLKKYPCRLIYFIAALTALKDSRAEQTLAYLDSLDGKPGMNLPYVSYLRGEALLCKGYYAGAIKAYREFLEHAGKNFVKDANYKTGICYTLLGDTLQARMYFQRARTAGDRRTEADRYADTELSSFTWPHPVISRLRYATDGGYYKQALEIIEHHQRDTFADLKHRVEFIYRTARLYHKLHRIEDCIALYRKTIALSGNETWYFAPNACLQLGYVYWQKGDLQMAEAYFRKALSYTDHAYKNSIDSKAKLALSQIKRSG